MEVSHLAHATLFSQEVITGEVLSCLNVPLHFTKGKLIDEPLRLCRLDLYEAVVETLIEGLHIRNVIFEELNARSKDGPDASELGLRCREGPAVCLLNRLLHVKHVRWDDASLSKEHRLVPGLWEIFKDPTSRGAVSHLHSLDDEAHEHVVLELPALSLQVLSELLTLKGILIHEHLDDPGHLKLHDSDFLREHLRHSCFPGFRESEDENSRLDGDVKGDGLHLLDELRWLLEKALLLISIR